MKNIMIILAFIASLAACTSGGEVVVTSRDAGVTPVTSSSATSNGGAAGSGGSSGAVGSSGSAGDSSLTSHQ